MPSQRKVYDAEGINIDIADESGISLKASHDLISAIAGGKEFVGFTREDQKTYLRAKRQRNLQYGETGSLLRYFQQQVAENPYFYYAIQLDVDEMITNIFWADHQMITDYGLFGDAVSFDTTFEQIRRKKLVSFFTDQDQAMAKAISQIMPEVFHGLYTFHLTQNALKHLGYLFKSGSKFSSDLKACIYDYENEHELIEAWNSLIDKYNLQENEWMKRTWRTREQWAHVYMKWVFTGGMRSTQLSENKWYEEISAIYDSRQKLPRMKLKKSPILIQVASLYTPSIFDLFHCELDTSLCCQVKQFHELEGEGKCVIGLYGNGKEYIVEGRVEVIGLRGEKSCQEIHCTCKKFENFGILCSHAIKAFDRMNVMKIPKRYILGRWRLDAKDCEVEEKNVVVDEDDPKLLILARYRDLCPRMVKLATQASMHKPAYQLVDEGIKELCVKVNNMIKGVENFGTNELDVDDPNFAQVKGIKKKDVGHKGRGRLKPWHEMMNKKTKVISQPTRLSKTIGQSSNTTNVQNSSSSQQQIIGQSRNTTNVQNSASSQQQTIGQSSNTTNVQNSSSSQQQTIGQSSNTTNVQNSSSSQQQTIGQSSNTTNVQNSSSSQQQINSLAAYILAANFFIIIVVIFIVIVLVLVLVWILVFLD
ncbi:protein FAR-RED IMPAIRED RESPONSE 1-like [Camellia sinensis]|uniref:protein FAR-RED IMPAIRED RESPONSE 1-like n=1 Tax=Camellia sinensis TaxID=4442 RepID=UPI001035FCD7|nr:protein FAR-RED IMPAIRED RESPONSE 1-like [Camellia sinensis]